MWVIVMLSKEMIRYNRPDLVLDTVVGPFDSLEDAVSERDELLEDGYDMVYQIYKIQD